jgi:hypothetical protein
MKLSYSGDLAVAAGCMIYILIPTARVMLGLSPDITSLIYRPEVLHSLCL